MAAGPEPRLGTSARQPAANAAEPRRVREQVAIVVPHTHWDREWYGPFETMRFHLVRFLDELIDALEDDERLPAFLLDGQAVLLEDYLEIRPEQRQRLAALIAAGRLSAGPFYVQPDEFLVSGEALVRNLAIGHRVAERFGNVLKEGYLPDTFGHVSQLPQILRGFGIETFYAMRGIGLDADEVGSEFWWQAPDGSRVLVHWLVDSYSNAAVLDEDPAAMRLHHGVLVRYDSLFELIDRLSARSRTGVLLLLNGGDHLRLQAGVPDLVTALAGRTGLDIRLGGLADFHRLAMARPLPQRSYQGEWRHGRYHDVFDSITSTRTPLKQLNTAVESRLCDVAERLDVLATLLDGRSNLPHLRHAWRELVKNHAHDSICGCSIDPVHDEMATRYTKIGQVVDAVIDDGLGRIAAAVAPAAPGASGQEIAVVVANPSPWPRSGAVSAEVLPDTSPALGERRFGWLQTDDLDLARCELLDPHGRPVPFGIGDTTHRVEDVLNRRKPVTRIRIDFPAVDIPPLGTAVYRLVPRTGTPRTATRPAATLRGHRTLENDRLLVVAETDGSLTLTDKVTGSTYRGLGALTDEADAGDEYTFSPLARDEPIRGQDVDWDVGFGPTEDSLLLNAVLRLPAGLTADRTRRSAGHVECPVSMTVRLPEHGRAVEVAVTVDNRASDHRLRAWFPTGRPGAGSVAESAFGVVRRSTAPAGEDWLDPPSDALPLRRFVAAPADGSGIAVLTRGIHEYSHTPDGALVLTLLRCVGWLSRDDLSTRQRHVGPPLATPGAQCLGHQEFEFAICPVATGWEDAQLFRLAEEFTQPLVARAVRPPTPAGATSGFAGDSLLAVDGPSVVLSALKAADDGDGFIVRVFNAADRGTTGWLRFGIPIASATHTDLDERAGRPARLSGESTVELDLAGGQIATVRIRPRAPFATARHGHGQGFQSQQAGTPQ